MKKARAEVLILGNSAAAVGAIEGFRRVDRVTPITLVAKEPYQAYSRPLISHLLAREIGETRMYLRPSNFYMTNGVQTILGEKARSVDPVRRRVLTTAGPIEYGKLLIAVGGHPVIPPIKGLGRGLPAGVFTFTGWNDAVAIDRWLKSRPVRQAVVLGGGLIGIKAAEALQARLIKVHMVELADHVLPLALDNYAAGMAAERIRQAGVSLECGTTVERVHADPAGVTGVDLRSGKHIPCEMLVVAIGVKPATELVRNTRIKCDRAIVVDEHCETTLPGIYAAGDVSQATDLITGEKRAIPIFPRACMQGRTAGINMAGGLARADRSFAMNSVDVFGLSTVSVGLANACGNNLEVLEKAGPAGGSYRRIVIRDGMVVGALFAGKIDRAGIVTGLIRAKINVSAIKDMLINDELGLLSLPSEYRKHVVEGEGIEI